MIQQQLNAQVKPLVENYPENIKQKIIKYDIIHNSGKIQGDVGSCFMIKMKYRDYKEIKDSFWMDQSRFQNFMFNHIPLIQTFTTG
jgi:hypothetical protein